MPRRKPRDEMKPGQSVPRRGGSISETPFTPQTDDGETLRSTLFGPRGQRSSGVLAGRGITSRGVGGGNATVERVSGIGQRQASGGFQPSPVQDGAISPVAGPAPIAPPSAPSVVIGPGSLIRPGPNRKTPGAGPNSSPRGR